MADFFKQVEDLNRYLEWPADSEIEHVNPEVYKKLKKDLQKERHRKLRSGDPRVRNSAPKEDREEV